MDLSFTLSRVKPATATHDITVRANQCIVAGWAGRDIKAIEEHIEELAELGVPRPSAVPLYYRIAANQLTQSDHIQVVGDQSSGEAEVLIFQHEGENLISLASDHTDRQLETHSVALSKQICAKPVARDAWLLSDVTDHWDSLILRAWITEDGHEVVYQDGSVSTLRHPEDLAKDHFGSTLLPAHAVMTCGTVGAIGGIRPAGSFTMELHDPVLNRSITHRYTITSLPEIA